MQYLLETVHPYGALHHFENDFEMSTSWECSICMEGPQEHIPTVTLACEKHTFHFTCAAVWFTRGRPDHPMTCPLCRYEHPFPNLGPNDSVEGWTLEQAQQHLAYIRDLQDRLYGAHRGRNEALNEVDMWFKKYRDMKQRYENLRTWHLKLKAKWGGDSRQEEDMEEAVARMAGLMLGEEAKDSVVREVSPVRIRRNLVVNGSYMYAGMRDGMMYTGPPVRPDDYEEDVRMVMRQVGVTREVAEAVLATHQGDLISTIMDLSVPRVVTRE